MVITVPGARMAVPGEGLPAPAGNIAVLVPVCAMYLPVVRNPQEVIMVLA